MRHTKKQLKTMTAQLNEKLGRPATSHIKNADGTYTPNYGHISLDHYNGYCLETMSEGGGVHHEFSHRRNTAGEQFVQLRTALDMFWVLEHGSNKVVN